MGRTALLVVCLASVPACASLFPRPFQVERLNRQLGGRVIDFTRNHGADRRLFSTALGEKRDLYVYVPPNYDPCRQYPLGIVLHGFGQDERSFLEQVIRPLDAAILAGKLPPLILACPDGTPFGRRCLFTAGTFFLNSRLGAFEDYIVQDIYPFLLKNYPIRPEREAHVLLGISMGGGAAFAKAIKYPQHFGLAAAVFPPVNLRHESCRGRYLDDFDPACFRLRTNFSRGLEPVGRFYGGLITIRQNQVVVPLFGRNNPLTAILIAENNPLEMIDLYQLKPGQVQFFLGYGGRDEFNIDAQVEGFLYLARQRGLEVEVAYDPNGRHNVQTALKLLPAALDWLRPRLQPYAPR
ncbi:MAG: alpha/beta hydrolase-fold protein [Gemmataceae bacterium]